jgi:hypothetical protein
MQHKVPSPLTSFPIGFQRHQERFETYVAFVQHYFATNIPKSFVIDFTVPNRPYKEIAIALETNPYATVHFNHMVHSLFCFHHALSQPLYVFLRKVVLSHHLGHVFHLAAVEYHQKAESG